MIYDVQLQFTEKLLASSPANPEVYKEYIRQSKNSDEQSEEVETLDQKELSGWSVFHKDEKGLFFFDYKIRGFLKEAATAITGKQIPAVKSKIDKWVFVFPRRIYLYHADQDLSYYLKPDGVEERPIRAMTMQGPRTSLKRSDYVDGAQIGFSIRVLPLGEKEFTKAILHEWLDYGALQGLGEWRNGSYGRFEVLKILAQSRKAAAWQ